VAPPAGFFTLALTGLAAVRAFDKGTLEAFGFFMAAFFPEAPALFNFAFPPIILLPAAFFLLGITAVTPGAKIERASIPERKY
jgi:hypothetical protein